MNRPKINLVVLILLALGSTAFAAFENVELEPVNLGAKTVNGDAADIDLDGDLDFLTSQTYFSHLHLTVNNGSSGLNTGYITNYANDGKFIDFDGDGYADIANVFNYGGVGQHGLQLRKNNGAGGFTHTTTLSNSDLGSSLNGINSMDAGDYDNDGDEDLILAGSRWNQHAIILKNDGFGNFTEGGKISWGNGQTNDAVEVQFADFDGDGDLDVFLLAQSWIPASPLPIVYENTGSGFVAAYTEPSPGTFLFGRDASVADMDNDGDLDIVAQGQAALGTSNSGTVIYENTGALNFTPHFTLDQTGQSIGGVRAADFDYDGDMDLVTTAGIHWDATDGQRLMILENTGGLTFVPGFEGALQTGTLATIVNAIPWVGDAEGDGDLEVMTGEYYAGFLWGFDSPPPVVEGPPPPTELEVSGWEMNRGGGWLNTGQHIGYHGNPVLYNFANIPAADDPNWGPAPNTSTIGFSETSQLPGGCLYYADFTYFQTFLSIPENTQLNEVTVEFNNADDGAQITVYNSLHPNGFSPPNAYIVLGGPAETTDISQYIAVGEVNRVVITQVDDCPSGNNLQYAAIVLNGEPIIQEPECEPETMSFTILGGSGTVGDIDPYTQASTDGGLTWGPAYLVGSHPWGYVPGTNSWVSWSPDKHAGAGTGPYGSGPFEDRPGWTWYDFRIQFTLPDDFEDASMLFDLKADNYAKVWINETYINDGENQFSFGSTGSLINDALQPGLNSVTLRLGDYGGIVAMNYRIDVSVNSCEVIDDPVVVANVAPTANAGADQTIDCVAETANVTLNGSGSDADGDDLDYHWTASDGTVYEGANPSLNLGGGTHTFTLTVDDGNGGTATDDVSVTVNLDVTAPVIADHDDITADSDEGVCGAAVSFGLSADDACGIASLTSSPASGDVFPVGTTEVTVTATDAAGNSSTSTFNVTVNDVEAPVIADLDDVSSENDLGECGAVVDFDFSATDNCDVTSLVADPASGSFFEVGETEVTVTATDAAGNESVSTFTVTVEDTEAPAFAAVSEAVTLWPPNHKYHTFDAADFVASTDDNCTDLSASDVIITSVSSDEPEDVQGASNGKGKKGGSSGGGDGNTKNDIVINGSSVDLRAERLGGGNGRVYTIYMAVTDEHGNTSTASAQVHVPHSKKSGAIDDGAAYTVNGASGLAKGGSDWDNGPVIEIPSEFGLAQNHPNPFNPSTQISYSMPEAGNVSLIVYDIRGAVVSRLVQDYQSAGYHSVRFDGSDLSAGTYIYVLNVGEQRFVERMLLVK